MLKFIPILFLINFHLISQDEITCFNIVNPISSYSKFEYAFSHNVFLEDFKNCLCAEYIKLELYKFEEEEIYLLDINTCLYKKENNVPFIVRQMIDKSYSCPIKPLESHYTNVIGKPLKF